MLKTQNPRTEARALLNNVVFDTYTFSTNSLRNQQDYFWNPRSHSIEPMHSIGREVRS